MHYPILLIVLPGNVVSQIELTLAIVLFDLMETFFDWESIKFLKFDEVDSLTKLQTGILG